MNSKEIKQQIEKLQQDLKLDEQEEKQSEFKLIKHKGKEYRLYKWENKPFKDFPMPNGFDFAEFKEAVELYNEDKLELESWKPVITKHFSKKQQKKQYCLSWLCLCRYSGLHSDSGGLAGSSEGGRILVVKIK